MARFLGIIGIVALLGSAWLLFEVENIWPFNEGRILLLRLLFGVGATACILAFLLTSSRIAPPMVFAISLALVMAYSRAVMTPTYIVSVVLITLLIAALACVVRRPLLRGSLRR